MDLWDALVWAYQAQRVHRVLRTIPDALDYAVSLDPLSERTPRVHPDAAEIHAAVLEALPSHDDRHTSARVSPMAQAVIDAAASGQAPEPSNAIPVLEPVPDTGRGRGVHVVDGVWIEVEPFQLRASDKASLGSADRGTFRRGGWLYEVDLGQVKHRRRRKKDLTDAEGKRRSTGPADGHTNGFRVFCPYCPVEAWPSAAYLDQVNAIYEAWYRSMRRVLAALDGVALSSIEIIGFDAPAPRQRLSPAMRKSLASLEVLGCHTARREVEALAMALFAADHPDDRWLGPTNQAQRDEYRRRAIAQARAGEKAHIPAIGAKRD